MREGLTAYQRTVADAALEAMQEIIADAAAAMGVDATAEVFSVADVCRLIEAARRTLDGDSS